MSKKYLKTTDIETLKRWAPIDIDAMEELAKRIIDNSEDTVVELQNKIEQLEETIEILENENEVLEEKIEELKNNIIDMHLLGTNTKYSERLLEQQVDLIATAVWDEPISVKYSDMAVAVTEVIDKPGIYKFNLLPPANLNLFANVRLKIIDES